MNTPALQIGSTLRRNDVPHPKCHEFTATAKPKATLYRCQHCGFSVRWPEKKAKASEARR